MGENFDEHAQGERTAMHPKKLDIRKKEHHDLCDFDTVYDRLVPLWPDTRPLLHYDNCWHLLIAVILSAQTTDEQVNSVTGPLFEKYPDATSLGSAQLKDVENIIHSVGFYHVKAQHIISAARALAERYAGSIPTTFEELLTLPGVGRKTANLVAAACLGIPGIIVDTHVLRVVVRLGLCSKPDPTLAERIIRENLPADKFTHFSYSVNRHGKFTCTSRNPACTRSGGSCPLDDICPRIGVKSTELT